MRVNWKKRVWDRDERKDNDAFRDDDVAKSEKILSLKSTPQRERIIQHEFRFNSFTRQTSFYLMPCFCKRFPNTHSNNFILTKNSDTFRIYLLSLTGLLFAQKNRVIVLSFFCTKYIFFLLICLDFIFHKKYKLHKRFYQFFHCMMIYYFHQNVLL